MNGPAQLWLDDALELFFGEAHGVEAHVYARLPLPVELAGLDAAQLAHSQLVGKITGPLCRRARTLPATLAFQALPPVAGSDALLARAVVPDPCFWSPEMPFVYQLAIEWRLDSQPLAGYEQPFGIRPLSVSERGMRLAGQGFVLRGAAGEYRPGDDGPALATCQVNPHISLCQQATVDGRVIVARVGSAPGWQPHARHWARYAAVCVVVVPPEAAVDADLRGACRNVLVAEVATPETPASYTMRDGIDLWFVDWQPGAPLPPAAQALPGRTIVLRTPGGVQSAAETRAACDRLQAELAPNGQFAGYLV